MSTQPIMFDYPAGLWDETLGTTVANAFVMGRQRRPEQQQQRPPVESSTSTVSDFASDDYLVTRQRVQELRENPEEDDDLPSVACFDKAFSTLDRAAQKLGLDFPRGSASVGPGLSIRVTWKIDEREVRLAVSDHPRNSYIYLDSGNKYGLSRNLNGEALAAHLAWLSDSP